MGEPRAGVLEIAPQTGWLPDVNTDNRPDPDAPRDPADEGGRRRAPRRIMVLIGPDPLSARLIRHAARLAEGMGASLCAVCLQGGRPGAAEPYLRLAEDLGARIVRLPGARPARDLLAYARQNGFTAIVVGHRKPPVWAVWRRSLARRLIEDGEGLEDGGQEGGELEIVVLQGARASARDGAPPPRAARLTALRPFLAQPIDYALAAGGVALCTALALPFRDHTPAANLAMIYLTGVVAIAARLGLGPSVLASLLSVPAFNFFFTQPYYSFNFYDAYYYVTLAFMLVASLLVGSLTARLSLHVQQVSDRERETQALYDLSRALSAERGAERICEVAVAHLSEPYDLNVTIFARDRGVLRPFPASALGDDMKEMGAVNWAAANGRMAGRDTDMLPSASGLYLPLSAEGETIGVLGLMPNDGARPFRGPEILQFGTAAGLIAGALQRARRSDEAAQSRVESENERLRNVLLSSLSHDLRTPLTVMNNSVSTLLRMRKGLPRKAMDELTRLWGQLTRLQKFVGNLLSMAAITSGQMRFNFQPYLIQEIIGAALSHTEAGREGRAVRTQIAGVLPMVRIDGALIEQVLVNLIENAYQHTAADGDILIRAEPNAGGVRVSVSDNGAGLKPGEAAQIFERFQTGQTLSSDRSGGAGHGAGHGSGLGLAICRGVIHAHGGVIHARNNPAPQPGARFTFTLPAAE